MQINQLIFGGGPARAASSTTGGGRWSSEGHLDLHDAMFHFDFESGSDPDTGHFLHFHTLSELPHHGFLHLVDLSLPLLLQVAEEHLPGEGQVLIGRTWLRIGAALGGLAHVEVGPRQGGGTVLVNLLRQEVRVRGPQVNRVRETTFGCCLAA